MSFAPTEFQSSQTRSWVGTQSIPRLVQVSADAAPSPGDAGLPVTGDPALRAVWVSADRVVARAGPRAVVSSWLPAVAGVPGARTISWTARSLGLAALQVSGVFAAVLLGAAPTATAAAMAMAT